MNTVMITMSALLKRYNAEEAQILNIYRENMDSPAFSSENFKREDVFSPVAVRFLDNVFGFKEKIAEEVENGVNAEAQKWKERADELSREVAKYEEQLLRMQENASKNAGMAVVEKYKIKLAALEKNYEILKKQNLDSLALKENHIKELVSTIESLQKDCQRNNKSLEQVIVLERELNHTKVSCEKLRMDLENARSSVNEMNARYAILENDMLSKNEELASVQGAISECMGNILSSFEILQTYANNSVAEDNSSLKSFSTQSKAADIKSKPVKTAKLVAAEANQVPKKNSDNEQAAEKKDDTVKKDNPAEEKSESEKAKDLMSWFSSKASKAGNFVGNFF